MGEEIVYAKIKECVEKVLSRGGGVRKESE